MDAHVNTGRDEEGEEESRKNHKRFDFVLYDVQRNKNISK